jgi:O-antigen ligase
MNMLKPVGSSTMDRKYLANLRTALNTGKLTFIACLLVMVVMPIHPEFIPPFIILWIVVLLFEIKLRERSVKPEKSVLVLFLCFMLYFLVLFSGLFYSNNVSNGKLLIFRRLSLLAFPLLVVMPSLKIRTNITVLFKVFVASTSFYIFICFAYAFYRSVNIANGIWSFNPHPVDYNWDNYFIGSDFSISQHPSYLAMYVVLSIFLSLEFWFKRDKKSVYGNIWLILSLGLSISLYFLASRSGFLSILILLPAYVLLKTKGKRRKGIIFISIALFATLLITLFIKSERIQNYLKEESNTPVIERLKADERVSIWKSAIGVFIENPLLGVGIGDSCDELKTKFKAMGFTKGYYDNLNAHNQFLEILLGSGIVGFTVLISILGEMIYIAVKNRNLLYGIFILMMVIFFMFESILNRLAGISFFALFSFLLIYFDSEKPKP